jgi:hypothetical protein
VRESADILAFQRGVARDLLQHRNLRAQFLRRLAKAA